MIHVKICGLTNLDDARHAWECGADLLGFVFVPSSPRFVDPATAAPIIGALKRAGCSAQCVGVMAGETIEAANRMIDISGIDLVQLHGGEAPCYIGSLRRPAIIVRRIVDVVPWDELRDYDAWAYLLDSYEQGSLGGTGRTWRWDALGDAPAGFERLIVAGGLTPDNVAQVVRRLKPWAVDVSSGVERSPGRKDPARVAAFIQRAKGAGDE
jgi:phosphoribosylanthranilate isomerase